MPVNPKYCNNCNIKKVNRASYRDKILKRSSNGKPELEQLGFNCKRCDRPWIQIIDYTKSGSARIKWKMA